MSGKTCPSCRRASGPAPGLCEACRLGVPVGTQGLTVEYPPEPRPSLRDRLRRIATGPLACAIYTALPAAALVSVAIRYPSVRVGCTRTLVVATGLSIVFLLIHAFRSLDVVDALLYLRRPYPFHADDEIDPRPYAVASVLTIALVVLCVACGTRLA